LSKKIGIIGCGWLGFPLAKSFLVDDYTVLGTTTSKEKSITLKEHKIIPFIITLTQEKIKGDIASFLEKLDVLIINVPPKLRGANASKESYVKKMQLLHNAVKNAAIKKIIFASSTSVYGNIDGDITEETIPVPVTESGKQMLASEKIFFQDKDLETTIIRFAGLIGADRHPVINLAKKTTISNGHFPVNLIHLEDCIRIIKTIVVGNYWNTIFNAAYPLHPSKKEYYTLQAKKLGLLMPSYTDDNGRKGKKIISDRLIRVKKFSFFTSIFD